jgi:hypothetical protein
MGLLSKREAENHVQSTEESLPNFYQIPLSLNQNQLEYKTE